MPQWIAQVDHLFAALHLERIWLGRHKIFHFRVWYRDQLANYVREMLLDSRSLSRAYLNPAAVRTIVSGHLKGNRNYTVEIHRLLTLELVHRLFLETK
jgi:asparagine synthase (glutamine-hydrolysing)